MSRRRQDLIDEILQAQFTVFRVSSAASAPVWIDLDLTMSQMKGLRALAFNGPATVSQLAEVLRISQPTASQLVDRLVQAGLVDREEDSADRRRTIVRLNRKGQQLHERLRGQMRDRFRHWLQRMSTDDLEALHRGYQELARIASMGHADGPAMMRPAGVSGKESEPLAAPKADGRIR